MQSISNTYSMIIDIYLTNKGIKCRGTDISSNCIKLAKENLKKHNLEDKIELYITDGVKNIDIYGFMINQTLQHH